MLDAAGVPAERHGDALIAIDKLDKIGRDGVSADLVSRGISEAAARGALDAFENVDNYLALARRLPRPAGALGAIWKRSAALSASTPANGHVEIVPRLARGLSYYTGAIMEIAVPDLAGSLGGGGRYDGLIGMFSGEQIPACGFSLGLERILFVMTERGMFPAEVQASGPDVLVTMFEDSRASAGSRSAPGGRTARRWPSRRAFTPKACGAARIWVKRSGMPRRYTQGTLRRCDGAGRDLAQ